MHSTNTKVCIQIIRHVTCFALLCLYSFSAVGDIDNNCKAGKYYNSDQNQCKSCKEKDFANTYHGFICPGENSANAWIIIRVLQCDTGVPNREYTDCNTTETDDYSLSTIGKGYYRTHAMDTLCDKDSIKKIYTMSVKNQYFSFASNGYNGPKTLIFNDTTGEANFYCPGDNEKKPSFTKGETYEQWMAHGAPFQGLKMCPDSNRAFPETNYTICEPLLSSSGTLYCSAGEYIPARFHSCQPCSKYKSNDTKGCKEKFSVKTSDLAFTYDKFYTDDVTKNKCPEGSLYKDENRTECVPCAEPKTENPGVCKTVKFQTDFTLEGQNNVQLKSNIKTDVPVMTMNIETPIYGVQPIQKNTCSPGQVYFNNQCTSCTSNAGLVRYANMNRMYCPAKGDLTGKNIIDQIEKCPSGMRPSPDLASCICIWGTQSGNSCKNVNLTKENLYYGPEGSTAPFYRQCWTKSDSASYKKCMGF